MIPDTQSNHTIDDTDERRAQEDFITSTMEQVKTPIIRDERQIDVELQQSNASAVPRKKMVSESDVLLELKIVHK